MGVRLAGPTFKDKDDRCPILFCSAQLVLARLAQEVVGTLLAVSHGASKDGDHNLDAVDECLKARLVGGARARLRAHVVDIWNREIR